MQRIASQKRGYLRRNGVGHWPSFTLIRAHSIFVLLGHHSYAWALYRGNTITGKPVVFIVAHKFKNPNRPDAIQLAVYKGDRGVELGTTENKSSKRLGRGLNSGPGLDYDPNALTARPPCLFLRRPYICVYVNNLVS